MDLKSELKKITALPELATYRRKPMALLIIMDLLLGSITCSMADSGYFWVINDIHLDPNFNGSISQRDSFHEGNKDVLSVGKFASNECDGPWTLVEASINALKQFGENPDFIIWNGDASLHARKSDIFEKDGKQVVLDAITNCTEALKRSFPNTPIFPSIGNHDYYPKNQHPIGPDDRMYDSIYDLWKPWIGADTESTFKKGAFYSKKLTSDLRFVVVNSNMWMEWDKETSHLPDPADQFQWLDDVLTKAEGVGEKVYLISHIPPGASVSKSWTEDKLVTPEDGQFSLTQYFNNRFVEIVEKHAENILAFICGHLHQDYFQVIFQGGQAVSAVLVLPAITPGGMDGKCRNPAVRRFFYDTTSYNLLDYEQYYFDLMVANKEGIADWKLEYSFQNSYSVPDMTKTSMAAVLQKLADDRAEFDKFVAYHSVMSTNVHCGDLCRRKFLCSMGNIRGPAWAECMNRGKPRSNAIKYIISILFLAGCLRLIKYLSNRFKVPGFIYYCLTNGYWKP